MRNFCTSVCLSFIALILGMFFCTSDVSAEKYSSDFIKLDDKSYSYRGEEITLSNVYFSEYNRNVNGVNLYGALFANLENISGDYLSFNVTVDYYDANYQLVANSTKTENPQPNSSNYLMNVILDEGDFLGALKYADIAYFKVNYDTSKIENNKSTKASQSMQYQSYEYVIDKYNVDMVVNENNTFDITETITAYFNVPKHGIFRTIPLKNDITRLDGTTSKNRVQITNLSVDNEYTTSRVNGNYKIKIGSASQTLKGEQNYVIKYTYNIGKDPLKDKDELYFNIIGTDWDTIISNVIFTITMPKEFDSSKIGFSTGKVGSIANKDVQYIVDGNKIKGSYDATLKPGEALTIRTELPEGYFVGAGFTINIMDYVMFMIPLLFLGISIFLWYKFGRDEQIVETVEFYPPAGFNSLEVGFMYKGTADDQDVTSLLIYLANKGYIKITEIEKKSLFSKSSDFKITKLKDYDGNNANEKLFLDGLFTKKVSNFLVFGQSSDLEENINEVTSMDLYNSFYRTMKKIKANINNKTNRNKIFEKSSSSKITFVTLMIVATYCLITIPPVFTYGEPATLLFALLFPGLGFSIMFSLFFEKNDTIYVNGVATHSSIALKIFAVVWGGLFGGIPWAFFVLPSLLQDYTYMIGYIIGICCVLGMVICKKYLLKRTPYGNEMLGKIGGFRNFLETAEKDRLEAMVNENPTYFYDILPFTYVLGVSDKWIKKFETIALQAPTWYDSPSGFNVVTFASFMDNTMVSAQNAMSSSPSSSSSGGSSGGGSSGGGSGGGGGGSW